MYRIRVLHHRDGNKKKLLLKNASVVIVYKVLLDNEGRIFQHYMTLPYGC